jgi:hypothetical protein
MEEYKTSKDKIYIPSYQNLSITLRKILKILANHHKKISGLTLEEQVTKFLTANQIPKILSKETDLLQEEKSIQAIQNALLELCGMHTENSTRFGYLYPILLIKAEKLICKICIIAPQIEYETEIFPFRKSCFEYSISAIDQILNKQIPRKETFSAGIHPITKVYNVVPSKELQSKNHKDIYFHPNGLSFESTIRIFLKKSFSPFNFFPFQDFMDDIISYAKKSNKLEKVTTDYHFIKSPVEVDEFGNYRKEPILHHHFFIQLKALEQFVVHEVGTIAKNYNFKNTIQSIEIHNQEFSKIYDDSPAKELNRFESLTKIIDEVPISYMLTDIEKSRIIKARQSISVIKILIEKLPDLESERLKVYITNYLEISFKKIIEYCKQKKQLYVLDLESLLKSMSIDITGYYHYFEEKFFQTLEDSHFGYLESKDSSGKTFYHIAYLPIVSLISHNLYILSFSNDSFRKQLEISKLIHSRAEILQSEIINAELSPEELARIKQETIVLDRRNKIRKRESRFQSKFNFKVGFSSILFSVLYFILLFVFFKKKILLYIAIPASVALGFLLSRLFSRVGLSSSTELKSDYEHNQVYEEITNILISQIQKNCKTTDDRIFHSGNFQEKVFSILSKVKNLPISIKEWKETGKDQILLNHYILPRFVTIKIPKELQIKKEPKMIFLLKEDLKSLKKRNELVDYYHNKRSNSKGKNASQFFSYYNFLHNCIDKEFLKLTN